MSNSLSAVHLELIAEWSEKNLPLTPDSTAFAYLPVLPCDFFLGAYPFARFIIEHAACGSLDVRLRKQFSFAEDKMDMIIGFAFVVVEG